MREPNRKDFHGFSMIFDEKGVFWRHVGVKVTFPDLSSTSFKLFLSLLSSIFRGLTPRQCRSAELVSGGEFLAV